jgi:hypothetical protein
MGKLYLLVGVCAGIGGAYAYPYVTAALFPPPAVQQAVVVPATPPPAPAPIALVPVVVAPPPPRGVDFFLKNAVERHEVIMKCRNGTNPSNAECDNASRAADRVFLNGMPR